MNDKIGFARMGAMIQTLATAGFFRKDDLEQLNRRFPDLGLVDIYLRTQPYKFGIYWMMLDKNRSKSAQYHLALECRAAFELLKRLVDLLQTLTLSEKQYLSKLLRGGIADDLKDVASVLTELDAYIAFKTYSEQIHIGDGKRLPDIRFVSEGKTYDIQCKSVGLSEVEISEVEGMYKLMRAASVRLPDLAAAKAFLAWRVKPGSLANPVNVQSAVAAVNMVVDQAAGASRITSFHSSCLDFVYYGRSSEMSFTTFITNAMPKPPLGMFIPVTPEILGDPFQNPTLHAFIFFSLRDHIRLAERAAKSFRKAMAQHDAMKSSWPLVFINVEMPSIMMALTPIAETHEPPNDHMFKSAMFYQTAIINKIRETDEWVRCKGLVLTSPIAPRRTPTGGTSWIRATNFFPPEGITEAQALPAFAKVRAALDKERGITQQSVI